MALITKFPLISKSLATSTSELPRCVHQGHEKYQIISEVLKLDELAGGIKVALITTVSGLIVAIILQIFYNYIVSKIDSLVNQMEDASISLIDVLVKHNLGK